MSVNFHAAGPTLGQPITIATSSDAASKVHFQARAGDPASPRRPVVQDKDRTRPMSIVDLWHPKSKQAGKSRAKEAAVLAPLPEAPQDGQRRPVAAGQAKTPRPSSMHAANLNEAESLQRYNAFAFKSGSFAAPSVPNILGIKIYTDEQRKFITTLQDQVIDLYGKNEALKVGLSAAKESIAVHERNIVELTCALNMAQAQQASSKELNDAYKNSISELQDCLADSQHAMAQGQKILERLVRISYDDNHSLANPDDRSASVSVVGTFGRTTVD